MSKHETKTTWKSQMQFETEITGGKIMFDADESFGGNNLGVSPKEAMLSTLAGCTGMDVVSLLKKMRLEFNSFRIEIDGQLTDEHPKVYSAVEVRYYFTGDNLDKSKIEKAVDLSVNKYCGVYDMFRSFAEMKYSIHINEV